MNNHEKDQKQPQQAQLDQENDIKHPHHIQEEGGEENCQHPIHIQHHHQQQSNQNQHQKEEEKLHNFTALDPAPLPMSSSSPPTKSPPSQLHHQKQETEQEEHFESPSQVLDYTHSSSYGYVYSPPEVLNYQESTATYQSSPPDQTTSYSYAYSPSSPDIKPAKPPSPPPPPPAAVPGKRPALYARKEEILRKRALLGCRVFGFFCCMISFSIMAADKNQGWAIDSFYRYKEFRYCMSVNVIGFVYSGLQSYDLAYSLATGRLTMANFRYLLNFSLDQILAYLLLSASTSAAFRVEDWESNWGKDKFPSMAKSSVVLSFIAFVAFALCSLLSGQIYFTPNST